MATITSAFQGTGATHESSAYSVRRMLYFWPVSGLTGDPVSASLSFNVRSGTTMSSKSHKLILFKDIIQHTDWKKRNANTWYQYNADGVERDWYFNNGNYTDFGTVLATGDVNFTLTGGAGNTAATANITIPSAYQDKDLWNGEDIFFGIVDNSGSYSPELLWGIDITCKMVLTCKIGPAMHYYNGSAWQDVKAAWYYTGSAWVEVSNASAYNGSAWISSK